MAPAPASLQEMYNKIKRMLLYISAESSETPVPINPQSSLMPLPSILNPHLRDTANPLLLTAWKQHLENSLPYRKNLFLHRCDKLKPHRAAQLSICVRIQSGIWVIATKKKKYTEKHCKKEGNYQNGFICIWNYFNTKCPANLPALLTNHQLR